MPLKLAFGVMEVVAGHRLGTLEGWGWASNASLPNPLPPHLVHRRAYCQTYLVNCGSVLIWAEEDLLKARLKKCPRLGLQCLAGREVSLRNLPGRVCEGKNNFFGLSGLAKQDGSLRSKTWQT